MKYNIQIRTNSYSYNRRAKVITRFINTSQAFAKQPKDDAWPFTNCSLTACPVPNNLGSEIVRDHAIHEVAYPKDQALHKPEQRGKSGAKLLWDTTFHRRRRDASGWVDSSRQLDVAVIHVLWMVRPAMRHPSSFRRGATWGEGKCWTQSWCLDESPSPADWF